MSELGRFWRAASGVGLSIVLVAGLGACAPSEPATLDDVLGNWEVSRVIKGSEDFPEETTRSVSQSHPKESSWKPHATRWSRPVSALSMAT